MSQNLNRSRYLPRNFEPDCSLEPGSGFWGVLYTRLLKKWGDPFWWPGSDAWEVAVGAILTQNTNWRNVEKALANLREKGWTDFQSILDADQEELAQTIRPSGYFNIKAKKLKELAALWVSINTLEIIEKLDTTEVRKRLLDVWGIGPETADSIALYAFGKPTFVVDAYTIRLVTRMRGLEEKPTYDEIQIEVHNEFKSLNPPSKTKLFNYLHGLIVVLAKENCTAKKPLCESCPLRDLCLFSIGC